jgi:hypothetical protein
MARAEGKAGDDPAWRDGELLSFAQRGVNIMRWAKLKNSVTDIDTTS